MNLKDIYELQLRFPLHCYRKYVYNILFLKNFKLLDIIIYQKNKNKKEDENLIEEMTVIVTNIRKSFHFKPPWLGFTKNISNSLI